MDRSCNTYLLRQVQVLLSPRVYNLGAFLSTKRQIMNTASDTGRGSVLGGLGA